MSHAENDEPEECPDCGKVFHRGDSKVTYTTRPFMSLPENKVSCPSCFKKIGTAIRQKAASGDGYEFRYTYGVTDVVKSTI